ncbi:MAG: TonB-dependent receptor [Runella sp.]
MKKIYVLCCIFCLLANFTYGQTTISGTITDASTNDPLYGVNVAIAGTVVGSISDNNGNFKIQFNGSLPVVLRVSLVGYITQEIKATTNTVNVMLKEDVGTLQEITVTGNRVAESITKSPVTIEKMGVRQFQQSAAANPFDALQTLKGVDLLTQSLGFKSVNMRGFGANNNNRFVQLTDGMDNRSPGLGFGFGNVAGISDLDIESIEIIPGASSALYGPDALQGLMLTNSKNPFEFEGLSAMVKLGANNFGSPSFSGPSFQNPEQRAKIATPYMDIAFRYAERVGDRFAFKMNFQRLAGTDFVANDYSDRLHRGRDNFFLRDPNRNNLAIGIAYTPNNDPGSNFQYDGVNIYGDDFNNASGFRYPANFANPALAGRLVTRTGYSELALLGNDGRVFSNRANVSAHYKLTDKIEASLGWYYGNGNLIRTAGFREFFPNYRRHQVKAELRGDNFFLRAYTTRQQAEGWNIGQTAVAINNAWKPLNTWANDFATAFAANGGNIGAARGTADVGRILPGTFEFNQLRDLIAGTWNNQTAILPNRGTAAGRRFRDNTTMNHYEGMYNFKNEIQFMELLVGGNIRKYLLESGGTSFPRKADGSEYTILEYGAYFQASKELKANDKFSIKPTVAMRYDKNEYFKGGLTPRASVVMSAGAHNFRASWQSAFRNPSPGQLLASPPVGQPGEVGGSNVAANNANLFSNPAYLENDVNDWIAGRITEEQLRARAYDPNRFTTEKIKTWEVGYKTLINNKLFVDAFYFSSRYSDFIAAQNMRQPNTGQIAELRTPGTFRQLQVNFNNFNEIFVNGWGFGLDYVLGGGYTISGNFANQVGKITLRDAQGNVVKNRAGQEIVKRRMSDPDVADAGRNFFISPENRYNISFSNPKLTDVIGFNINYRWTDQMWVEQGTTAGDIWLPSWTSLDAQVSFKLPAAKSILKIGGSNILNKYYSQGYGLAQIGGLYYISLTFDELMR